MNKKEYNGWFNYETWLCNLHFDNFWQEQAEEIYRDAEACDIFSREENAVFTLADVIEQDVEMFADEDGLRENGFFGDLLNAALQEVNHHEIARHYIEDIAMNEAA